MKVYRVLIYEGEEEDLKFQLLHSGVPLNGISPESWAGGRVKISSWVGRMELEALGLSISDDLAGLVINEAKEGGS